MEKDIILQVENLSKQYRLGVIGTGTISHDLNRWWHKIRGKEDPYQKIGEKNSRTEVGDSQYVWALKDVSFEVKRGEVLGIIGKNGAGKSTLLKLLSKVTTPTKGTIKSKGRIASLLEVGTGFHPELTGKENIFLNGAILGMTKAEIKSKFDEIVEFAGVQRYVNTPVKRYSSGMKVRLAFAVAAHLEPEILIVDEVLAVGDAEFQKKAIGKMQDISKGEGRTVLFVSHDMNAILRLCKTAILLNDGSIVKQGRAAEIVEDYLSSEFGISAKKVWEYADDTSEKIQVLSVEAHDAKCIIKDNFYLNEKVGITMRYKVNKIDHKIQSAYNFYNTSGINIFDSHESNTDLYHDIKEPGVYEATAWIPENLMSEGVIVVGVALVTHDPFKVHFHDREVIAFNMIDEVENSLTRGEYVGSLPGVIRPLLHWNSKRIK